MIPARIVLATANPGKVAELTALLREWGPIEVLALDAFPWVVLPPEDGTTYAENAIAKATAVMRATGLPALGDDSGLEVAALDGGPGVRSARFAPTDAERIARLLAALAYADDRTARFRCVVALAWPDGRVETAEGTCAGRIAEAASGTTGFGYDPVFAAADLGGRVIATVTPEEKQGISHRARAVRTLGARLTAVVPRP